MKKYILCSLIALGSVSCTDSFLEEKMVSTITQDYFETEQGLEQLIVGTYDALRVTKQYEQGPNTFMLGVDNFTNRTATRGKYSPSEWNANGRLANWSNSLCGEFSKSLLGYYPIINNCNRAISSIREGKAKGKFATDPAYAAKSLSEALFNRAYAIYMMSTMYGAVYVPLNYTAELPANYNYARMSVADIYSLLISDLRYAYDNLPDVNHQNLSKDFGKATKGAAAHFLAKLYLQRAQGLKYGTSEYGVDAAGNVDNSNPKSYLGMLYKGEGVADLDSCIYFTSAVINHPYYKLESDFGKLFSHKMNDYSNESSHELILSCVYGPVGSADNGRFGNRLPYFFGGDYVNAAWGIPEFSWDYPTKSSARVGFTNDFGFDLYVNKLADSRYQKSFHIEYKTALRGGDSKSVPTPNVDYYKYDDAKNATFVWTDEMASYFNKNILPTYNRESWGGREAVAGEHKMGRGDLAFAYLENSKETAISIEEALAQPFVLIARWIKDGNKYYYRVPYQANGKSYAYNATTYGGLDKFGSTVCPATLKYDEPNRSNNTHYESGRDVPLFRLAETHLMRAMAYGLQNKIDLAIDDINKVRVRAAYKVGENRSEVLARLQPGHENLTVAEQQWPYEVTQDMSDEMKVDVSYWDGSSANSKAEMYPATATTSQDRFVNFVLNEMAREMNQEMVYYEHLHHSGWQADRIIYHDQLASPLKGLWSASDNLQNGIGQTGDGMGLFEPHYTLKPFAQSMLDMLTDDKGVLLNESAKKAYQNYGY